MSVHWPQTLVKEIARRRCVFFLGAGVSSSAEDDQGKRPKGWIEFLSGAAELIHDSAGRVIVKNLVEEKRYLLALQAIRSEVDGADYHEFLNTHLNNQAFQPKSLHDVILKLDSRIVITTNFDKIYEKYCLSTSSEGFKVIPYDSESLADELRSDTRLIIKAHGTIDNIQKMVFTKAEYHEAKRDYPQFYEILKAIFLTSTVVFIGCSLEDPDVQLVLEDVHIAASSQRPHYALVKQGEHSKYMVTDWSDAYNIKALTYGPEYSDLTTSLEELLQQVEQQRLLHQN